MSLSPRHERTSRPIPPHPYRDSALFHGALAIALADYHLRLRPIAAGMTVDRLGSARP